MKNLKNKKALSTVVATVIIILLTVSAIAIVWTFTRDVVVKNRDQVESCLGVETGDKVTLNGLYTCYTIGGGGVDLVRFSINIADVEVNSLIVSIMASGKTKTITLTKSEMSDNNIRYYGGAFGESISLPGKNSGKTYEIRNLEFGVTDKIDLIRIAPIINNNQCEITSQIRDISNCNLMGD